METVPDTGGGLSGFIASIIWQVYRYFPSSGSWDWLLLFFALTILGIALFWPYLWRAVSEDMRILAEQEIENPVQELVLFVWAQVWQWLLIVFFYSDAGRALLEKRQWFGSGSLAEVNRTLYWISFGTIVVLVILIVVCVDAITKRTASSTTGKPMPFRERSLTNLFCGGGVFYYYDGNGTLVESGTGVMIALFPAANFLFLVFYWYWSAASILLMHSMLLAVLFNEVVRMTFIYIQHRRTFG